jgi:hypothetical protein
MLIQETHADVPTKADGKEGSMSMSTANGQRPELTSSRDLPLSPHYPQLPQSVGLPSYCQREITQIIQTVPWRCPLQRDLPG